MLLVLMAVGMVAVARPSDPCAVTAGHQGFTILMGADGQFCRCRDGKSTDTEPMSQERVVLQLPPPDPAQPYRYRLFDPAAPPAAHEHRLLRAQLETIRQFEAALQDLASSSEDLGDTLNRLPTAPPAPKPGEPPAPPEGQDVLEAQAAQAKYMSRATPAFIKALHLVRKLASAFDGATAAIDIACGLSAAHVRAGMLRDRVVKLCAEGGPGAQARVAIEPFRNDLEAFIQARIAMKDLVIDAHGLSSAADPAALRNAVAALNAAAAAARKVVAEAEAAAVLMGRLASDVEFLRAAISFPVSEKGARIHLGRFSADWFTTPDICQVRVVRDPSLLFDLADTVQPSQPEPREVLVARFQPVARDALSLGLAALYSVGLPDHPDLVGRVGAQTLAKVPTQGFVGGVEISLKPLEFTQIPDPVAALLHFPVVIIPFTLNPLENYFIGAGVGWEGLGSLDVGVHLAQTTVPAPNTPYGTQFTTSPILLDHVTAPGPYAGGFFVGLTVDVLGIVQTIIAQRHPSVRDIGTGNEAR